MLLPKRLPAVARAFGMAIVLATQGACKPQSRSTSVLDSLERLGCDRSLVVKLIGPGISENTACVLATTARRAIAQGHGTVAGVTPVDTTAARTFYVLQAELHGNGIVPDSRFWGVTFEVPTKGLWMSISIDRDTGAISAGRTEPMLPLPVPPGPQ